MKAIMHEISEIQSLDLEHTNISELEARLQKLFHGYIISTPIVDPGQKLFRGVRWPTLPDHISKLKYPPTKMVSNYGRINAPGESIFYCSVSRSAVSFELRLKVGEKFVLSRWHTKVKILLNNVGFTDAAFKRVKSDRSAIPSWKPIEPDHDTPLNRTLHNFFSSEFTREISDGHEFEYKISVAIARILMHDIDQAAATFLGLSSTQFGGIVYPALAMRAHSDNVALRPTIVDDCLQFENAEYIQVDKLIDHGDYQEYKLNTIDFANSLAPDEMIQWKGRPAQWNITIPPGGKLYQSIEDGQTIYRDETGKIIEPD